LTFEERFVVNRVEIPEPSTDLSGLGHLQLDEFPTWRIYRIPFKCWDRFESFLVWVEDEEIVGENFGKSGKVLVKLLYLQMYFTHKKTQPHRTLP